MFFSYSSRQLNQYNKADFLFQFTSLQVIKEKLFKMRVSLEFYVYMYPCYLTCMLIETKLKSKVVFIILLKSPTTVIMNFLMMFFDK